VHGLPEIIAKGHSHENHRAELHNKVLLDVKGDNKGGAGKKVTHALPFLFVEKTVC